MLYRFKQYKAFDCHIQIIFHYCCNDHNFKTAFYLNCRIKKAANDAKSFTAVIFIKLLF